MSEPETYNGFQDDDGCPDQAPVADNTPPPTSQPVIPPPESTETEVYNPSGITSKVVSFGFNVDTPDASFWPIMDEIAKAMIDHPEIKRVRIEGHTDNVGTQAYNQGLSERRAKSVAKYLVSKGVDASRLETKGFGFSRPIDPAETEEARSKNRRIEFVIEE